MDCDVFLEAGTHLKHTGLISAGKHRNGEKKGREFEARDTYENDAVPDFEIPLLEARMLEHFGQGRQRDDRPADFDADCMWKTGYWVASFSDDCINCSSKPFSSELILSDERPARDVL